MGEGWGQGWGWGWGWGQGRGQARAKARVRVRVSGVRLTRDRLARVAHAQVVLDVTGAREVVVRVGRGHPLELGEDLLEWRCGWTYGWRCAWRHAPDAGRGRGMGAAWAGRGRGMGGAWELDLFECTI